MDASTGHLQPDSADTGKDPDTTPEAMQALFDKIKAAYLSGRAAQDAAGGGQ